MVVSIVPQMVFRQIARGNHRRRRQEEQDEQMRKTQEEIDAMTSDQLKAYKRQQEDIVYGSDAPRKNGRPVEQGIGSPLQPSENHVAALRNSFGINPNDAQKAIIAKAEKELADYRAKRQARVDAEESALA